MHQTLCDHCKKVVVHPESFTVEILIRNNKRLVDEPEMVANAHVRQSLDICPDCIEDFKIRVTRRDP